MSTLATFVYGSQGSASAVMTALNALEAQGQAVLDALAAARLTTLVEFDRRLSSINSRRQRVNRVISPEVAVKFTISDFVDIDQISTTATVRADAGAVTLRERGQPADATIKSQRFSSDIGLVATLDNTQTLFQVHTDNGQKPTGQFDIELLDPLTLSLIIFDIAAMPSDPVVEVSVSTTGVTYVAAHRVEMNGYRVAAWLTPQETRFVRVNMQPSHPDALGGSTYSFGLTDFTASAVEFQLLSELVTKPLVFQPLSLQLRLNAAVDADLDYFVSLAEPGTSGSMVEVAPGGRIAIPGVAMTSIAGIGFAGTMFVSANPQIAGDLIRPTVPNGFLYLAVNSGTTGLEPVWPTTAGEVVVSGTISFITQRDGQLAYQLPPNVYLTSISVTQDDTGHALRVAPGLDPFDINASRLVNVYVSVLGQTMYIVSADVLTYLGKTFSFTYLSGPAAMSAILKVQLSTADRAVTPSFPGASLEQA